MNIVQTFYDDLAQQYDKLFLDWEETTREQGILLHSIFERNGFDRTAQILDCACGIGTQAIGLARLGYPVTASDISTAELAQAEQRAAKAQVNIRFAHADFCRLREVFTQGFDIIIAMDNALPHMLSREALAEAVKSITGQLKDGGIFAGSIRDYDALLETKPPYAPPYIHKTDDGQRVAFQTWDWEDDCYDLTQYIIEDGKSLSVSKFPCRYRATRRQELTQLLMSCGYRVQWLFPEETGFYQPIFVAKNSF